MRSMLGQPAKKRLHLPAESGSFRPKNPAAAAHNTRAHSCRPPPDATVENMSLNYVYESRQI